MNGKYLLDKLELIDPEYINAAEKTPKKKPIMWQQWTALAACLAVAVSSLVMMALTKDDTQVVVNQAGDTASLFSGGGIPLIALVTSLLAALAIAALMIKKKK